MYIEKLVRKKAERLIKKQHTTDPKALLDSMKNVTYDFSPTGENVNGFYIYISAKKQILAVKDTLQGLERDYAAFHELGHVVLEHKGRLLLNCPTVNDIKEENEADLFAAYMIIKHHGITKENADDFLLPVKIRKLVHKFLK